MPKSYSADIRKRVIEAVASGVSRHKAAELFGICGEHSGQMAVALTPDTGAKACKSA
jgi:hypothetical protein